MRKKFIKKEYQLNTVESYANLCTCGCVRTGCECVDGCVCSCVNDAANTNGAYMVAMNGVGPTSGNSQSTLSANVHYKGIV